jgi:pimeloyl-ACP methyl ester carboxylesterase
MLPWPAEDAAEMVRTGGDQSLEADYAGRYRDDLATHPGCMPRASYGNNVEFLVSDNEATVAPGVPADIDGYPCAAKEYTQPAENTDLPIVILVHGNSSSVTSFEEYANATLAGTTISNVAGFSFTVESEPVDQLPTRLVAAGHRVIGFDARTDLVNTLTDFDATTATGNAFRNIDHGWAVPMLQALIRAVMTESPGRRVALVGHSLGVTVIRDALRRLYNEHVAGEPGAVNPFAQLSDVVLLSGANHGVSSGALLCETFDHMRGTVGCEMGDRGTFIPTYFTRPLNGPNDLYATPCADGDYAFGMHDACGGNVVEYTTVTMQDIADGELQDEFVSETSSSIDLDPCVANELLTLADYDASGYFFTGAPGFFANHFGSARSAAGITLVTSRIAD